MLDGACAGDAGADDLAGFAIRRIRAQCGGRQPRHVDMQVDAIEQRTRELAAIALDLCKAALFQRFALLDEEAFFTGVVIGVASIPGSAAGA